MKFVRTSRDYQALTVEVDGKRYTVDGVAREVSDKAAAQLEKAGQEYDVAIVVSDEAPEAGAYAVGQPPVDLSRGVAAVSGTGAPVSTFTAATAATDDTADEDTPAAPATAYDAPERGKAAGVTGTEK